MPDRTNPSRGSGSPGNAQPLTPRALSTHAETSPVVGAVEGMLGRYGITVYDDDLLLDDYRDRERDAADLIAVLAARGIDTTAALDRLLSDATVVEPALGIFRSATVLADREPGGTIEDLLTIVVFLLLSASRDEVERIYGEPTATAVMQAIASRGQHPPLDPADRPGEPPA